MNDEAATTSRPSRSILRVSVRGLIVLVLAIGVGADWTIRYVRFQPEAATAIRRTGGWVLFDWENRGDHGEVWGEPDAPGWLTDLIGVECFGHITEASLGRRRGLSDAITMVGRLDRLERLDLSDTVVTDAELAYLRRLARLSRLDLTRTQVTNAGLMHLAELTELAHLELGETKVSDAGLVHLKGLTKLRGIDLRGTQVTDAGIERLRRALPRLYIVR